MCQAAKSSRKKVVDVSHSGGRGRDKLLEISNVKKDVVMCKSGARRAEPRTSWLNNHDPQLLWFGPALQNSVIQRN
jgi:hypothetical protein